MQKQEIMSKYPRNLTHRFNGGTEKINIDLSSDKNISAGIANQMTFIVENKKNTPLPFALIPANFDTLRAVPVIELDTTSKGVVDDVAYTDPANPGAGLNVSKTNLPIVDGMGSTINLVNDNIADMVAAGFPVGGVLFDGEHLDEKNEVEYKCYSADPARSIKQFLRYLQLNPLRIKNMEIVSEDDIDASAFDTTMMLTYVNPFFRNAQQQIDLSTFFNLFQESKNRIRMDFDGQVELSDLSLLTTVIPAGKTMKYIMRFE